MSEAIILDEPMTGYVATDLSGCVRQFPEDNDYQASLINREPIGYGDREGSPFLMGNPTITAKPEGYVMGWPCRLFRVEVPMGAVKATVEGGRLLVSRATVVAEEDSSLALGPQHDELFSMATSLLDVTREQQEAMSALAAEVDENDLANAAVRRIAKANGRNNSSAIMNLMWVNAGVWARHPIGNAAMAVAHRDLLVDDTQKAYYDSLYGPWREVMGE